MSEADIVPIDNRCFVCGPHNPHGLQVRFRLEDGTCRAEFTPGPHHGGWSQLTHGGILYSLLDDVMANWLFFKGLRAHTAKCEVRYRQPVMLGTTLLLEGQAESQRARVAVLSGVARRADDGVIVAEARGTFMIVDAISAPR